MAVMAEKKKVRKGDRHGPHKMLRLPMDLYLQLEEIAAEHERPIAWEGRIAVRWYVEHVRKQKGKLPDE